MHILKYYIKHYSITDGSLHLLKWLKAPGKIQPFVNSYKSNKRNIEKTGEQILFNSLNINNPSYLSSGKPILKENYISITHSQEYIALYISDTIEVGIDLEKVHTKMSRIYYKFINQKEHWCKNEIDYTRVWCCKEVVFKYLDIGNLDFKNHIFVTPIGTARYNVVIECPQYKGEILIETREFNNTIMAYNILP